MAKSGINIFIDKKQQKTAQNTELGFGNNSSGNGQRFLNQDGSYNVKRDGLPWNRITNFYHSLMMMSWTSFLTLIVLHYLFTNIIFAFIFEGPFCCTRT
jgi:inward rectifier potassium channel